MADTRWTNEQLEAITEKDCNLLVAAAAGAGKTAVLVERIIRKITCDDDPVDIDKLLIVTFTNAAATEMRERIAEAVSKSLDKNPDSRLLQRQLALLNKANITTIHSFCLDVIRNNFHYIGLNPGFKISDETEALLLKIEALDDLFEEIYSEDTLKEEFFDLLECYGGNRDDQALKNLVLTLYDFIQSYPWPEEWLKEKVDYFNINYPHYNDFAKTRWGRILLEYISVELMSLEERMEKAISVAEASSGLEPYLENLQEEKRQIGSLIDACIENASISEANSIETNNTETNNTEINNTDTNNIETSRIITNNTDIGNTETKNNKALNFEFCNHSYGNNVWDNLYNAFQNLTFNRLPRCKKDADKEQQEYVKSIRDEVKKQLKKLQNDIFISSSKDIIEDLKHMHPLLKYLAELVMKFDNKYSEIKRSKSLLDFNDLEHFCLEILAVRDQDGKISPSNAAREYKERFEEILVDEYQDSNMVQEIILNIISRKDMGKPNIFMVGDVKQSIYRFRQAKPELFLEKYNKYSSEKGGKYRKIQLFKNFRSRRNVIDTVNFIFSKIMSEKAGELNYDEKEALNFGATIYDEADAVSSAEAADFANDVNNSSDANIINYINQADGSRSENVPASDKNTELHIIEIESEDKDNISSDEDADDRVTDESVTHYGNEDGYTNEDIYDEDSNLADIYGLFSDEPIDNVKCEARLVSQKIQELMGSFRVYDNRIKSYRPVEYRDIVILLRSTRNWSDVFVEELGSQGIPVYADAGSGFFKTIEVQIMLSLLQVIDNPLQDIPLLAVLRAPFAAFTPDEMADIRLIDREATLYEALAKASGIEKYILIYDSSPDDSNYQDGDNNTLTDDNIPYHSDTSVIYNTSVDDNITIDEKLREKAAKFLETLEKWRNKALYMSTDELIWYLYTDTGFYSFVGAMPGGEQRQANLRMLFEHARRFEETSYRGLFNFINFINKIKVSRGDMGSAKILGENENVVRIMSIHKSKGLEFPVVFLSGCGKGFNMQDLNKNIILHQELGFGPDYVDYEKRISYPTMAKQALRYQIKKESLSEEMRILYVALTRAKEKLILTGTVKKASASMTRWKEHSLVKSEKIPSYIILKGKNFLDWICPALVQNEEYEHNIRIWSKDQFKIENTKEGDNAESANNIDNANSAGNTDNTGNMNDRNEINEINQFGSIEEVNNGEVKYRDEILKEIDRRLSWVYKYKNSTAIPVKVSVTELKRRFVTEFVDEYPAYQMFPPTLVKKPAFLEQSKGLSSAEIGTVLHFVMQHLDLKHVREAAEIKSQVEKMVEIGLLNSQQASYVDINKILRYFRSDIGQRMLSAARIYREVPFNIRISSNEILKVPGPEEMILLQGVIDCFFEEKDGLVLLDYKTDYISPNEGIHAIGRIKARYATQLKYYQMVLEKLLDQKVKEKYIYLFWNGETIKL